jgi:uncharacterized protein (DUF1684 family)
MTDFATWIESRNTSWRNPTGFLAVTSMNWLDETPQTFTDFSGSWHAIGHEVFSFGFEGAAGQSWVVEEGGEVMVAMADGVLELASRGGRIILRPRNRNSEALTRFSGVDVFDYGQKFVVSATLIEEPRNVGVSSAAGELGNNYDSPGCLVFDLGGEQYSLTAFGKASADSLWIIFRDATSGVSTYATGRSVSAVKDGERWIIDFNRSSNFPCSYTDFATCPLAPRENHIDAVIAAGEKTPDFRITPDGLKNQ